MQGHLQLYIEVGNTVVLPGFPPARLYVVNLVVYYNWFDRLLYSKDLKVWDCPLVSLLYLTFSVQVHLNRMKEGTNYLVVNFERRC